MVKATLFKCVACNKYKCGSHFKPSTKRTNTKKKYTQKCQECRDRIASRLCKGNSKGALCKRWWTNWRKNNPCIDCGELNPLVVSADHRLNCGKLHRLGDYQWWAYNGGVPAMEKEIKKCVSRCISCHRLRTREDKDTHLNKPRNFSKKLIRRRQIRNELAEMVDDIKCSIGACFHCKRRVTPKNVSSFDFDHLVPTLKKNNVSTLIWKACSLRKMISIKNEIDKCVLLCANCHHLKTNNHLELGYIRPINLKQMQEQRQETTDTEIAQHPRFFSLVDQNINEPEQRSPEWFDRRRGKLSGSKLSQFLFIKTQAERIKFAEEVFEGRRKDPFTPEQQKWVKWGQDHEDTALEVLLDNVPNLIAMEAPMVQHSSVQWLASSPDGFYHMVDALGNSYETGCIEIKCPGKSRKANTKTTYYYVPQMYLEMACSGHDKVIFCSWGPKVCRAWKLEFDHEVWNLLCQMMTDLKKTKTSDALSFEQWSILQYRLKTACHNACNKAVPLHESNGWHSTEV